MRTNDEILWHIAKKRAAFKKQLVSYVIVNCFLSGNQFSHVTFPFNATPWPVWVMFWWGIGLAFSFVSAYLVNTKESIETEFQKLKNQQ
jgi:hypothetical protein